LCPECGYTEDRDLNAAKNIERWFDGIHIPERSEMAVSSTVSAGEVDKPDSSYAVATLNQEVNSNPTHVQLCLDLSRFV
ncbi:MAG: hypothetical protein WBF52_16515, partial [Geitlerinemataceae cyanobacterium]